ncbi:MAG TPA: hypothetical protein VH374_06700 [Polyangia bacterium]|jgi:Tol biopolymer transport system component|nr:hypothetical protein [Polyangia bacterium]
MRIGAALAVFFSSLVAAALSARADATLPEPAHLSLPALDADRLAPQLPVVHWHTLETPHFRIHYYDDEKPLADRAAPIAERAHRLVTRYLNWLPSGRVDITLNDQTDSADGFASSVPRNYLFGYGAAPASLDELNDFDDFLKVLITHEFTHVVHLDTIIGLPRALNFLAGKLYAPNLSQPNWWIEGLAVLMETRQTTGGRLRSTFFDMHLRAPFIEDRLLDLAAVSNGPLEFPQGTAAYLYGSSLLRFIEDTYGPEKLQEISHRYGSHLIPGGMNRIAHQAIGAGYDEIWLAWRASMQRRYSLQEEEARRRGLTAITQLTFDDPGPRGEGLTPRYFRDGRGVVYHRENTDQAPAFILLDPATGHRKVLAEFEGTGGATPTPDGRSLVFHRTNFLPLPRRISGSSHVAWEDIFRYDIGSGALVELTHGQRAHEPDVSPDGKWVAYTTASTGARQLAVCPTAGGAARLLTPHLPGLAYTPAWSPDGRRIAYSRWQQGGFRDLHIFDLQSGTDRTLWRDRAMDMDPRFSPDGRYLLFSSDRTGIYNIFAFDLDKERLYQVTNVLTGAFQPAVSPDGKRLVFTGFTSHGFDLFSAAYQPANWLEAQPYANARPDAGATLSAETDTPDAIATDEKAAADAETVERVVPYQPWKYMYPRTWVISLPSDPLGLGASLGIQTNVGDPVGNHGVSINTLIPTDGDASVRLDYSYVGLWPSLSLTVARSAVMAGGLVIDHVNHLYRQHAASASASMGLPILRLPESSADLTFGYQYSAYAPADPLPVADPTAGISVAPETGPNAGGFLSWSFSNAHSWPYSISPQEGRRLQLTLSVSSPSLGSKFTTTELNWLWVEYLSPPWSKLQALALLYSGGVGIGDKRSGFAIGGFTDQDLVRSLFLNRHQCCLFLRGYQPDSFSGDQYHLFSAEFRSPLLRIERGYGTFPLYVRRVHGALFADAGNAFFGGFHPSDLKYGVGGELRIEMNLAYYLYTELQLGVAKGLSTGGSTQYYFVSAFPF